MWSISDGSFCILAMINIQLERIYDMVVQTLNVKICSNLGGKLFEPRTVGEVNGDMHPITSPW